MTKPPLFQILK